MRNYKSKLKILVLLCVLAIFVGAMSYLAYKDAASRGKVRVNLKKLEKQYKDNKDVINIIHEIQKAEGEVRKEPTKVIHYATLGLAWKSLGEQLKDRIYFAKARDVYKRGVELTNWTNSVFTINVGVVSEIMDDFETAEKYYNETIAKMPAEINGYRSLADLYKFKLNKKPEEILAVYDKGINTLVYSGQLAYDKGAYLESIGRYNEALDVYNAVYKASPSDSLAVLIKNLEEKIKQ